MVFTFQENALNLFIFTHGPVSHSKLQVQFFKDKRCGRNYDLLYYNAIRKYEDDLEH